MLPPTAPAAIVCFGETLWDLLPTGRRPGGALCNVALHLHELGQPVRLVSRVGDDDLGHELLARLAGSGLDATLMQLSASHLTGVMKARPGGPVRWEIVRPLAWDYIQHTEALRTAASQAPMLVYGTLAARGPVSRETLYRLLPHAPFKALVLNLCRPHYTREVVRHLLHQADLLLLTEAELAEVLAWQGQPTATPASTLPWLAQHFRLQAVCLLPGPAGAALYAQGAWWHQPDSGASPEAFVAVLLAAWAGGHPPAECLRRAGAAGSYSALSRGAPAASPHPNHATFPTFF